MTPPVTITHARLRSRRAFIATLGLAGAGAATAAYARYWEPDFFQVHTVRVPRRHFPAPAGLRVLHLSDFHYGPFVDLPMIAEAIRLGLAGKPDLICLTGDFVTGRLRDAEAYAETLRALPQNAPTYACMGNHDGLPGGNPKREETSTDRVMTMLESAGIRTLHNATETVTIRDMPLRIAGVGDLWAGETRPATAFGRAAPPVAELPTLLMNHNPDARKTLMPYPWHLMLCGHTHGGQCGLPWVAETLAPVSDKSHIEGLRLRDGRLIHITRGVGNQHGIRLFCRPQISLLEVV